MSLNAGHDPDPDEGGGRFPEIRQAGRIGDSAGRRYATRATTPSITGLAITSDPGSDNRYVFRDKIEVTVTFSEAVTVTGSPRLTLLLGSPFWIQLGRAARNADFARQPELRKLVFAYTVAADDSDPDGVSIAADSLSPNGGTIVGSDDTAGRLTHDALAAQPRHLVDTIAPTVLDIFVDGRTLSIGYSEALDMASVPAASRFRVHVDNAVRSVSDVSVANTAVTLTLAAAVLPGEEVDIRYSTPQTGPIRDLAGHSAAGFAFSAHEVVNETRPTVSIAAADDAVYEGTDVEFRLTRNGPVIDSLIVDVEVVDRGNFLEFETGTRTLEATFEAGNSTAVLTLSTLSDFDYEADVGVTATVRPSSRYAVSTTDGSATVTISDNDVPETAVTMEVPASVAETSGTLTVRVRATTIRDEAPHGAVSIVLASADGTAAAGEDFAAIDTVVRFAAGDFERVEVAGEQRHVHVATVERKIDIHDDAVAERDETFTLHLRRPVGVPRRIRLPDSPTEVSITDNEAPDRPANVAAEPGDGMVTVSWSEVASATGYKVQWKSGAIETFDAAPVDNRQQIVSEGATTSAAIGDLTNGTGYTLQVIAFNSRGDGPASPVAMATPQMPPALVTEVTLTEGDGSLTVSWRPATHATGYKVQWKSGTTESFDTATADGREHTVSGALDTRYAIGNLENCTPYAVRIVATNHGVDGPASAEAIGTPNFEPERARSGATLVSNTSHDVDGTFSLRLTAAGGYTQEFTTGSNTEDFILESVGVRIGRAYPGPAGSFPAYIYRANESGGLGVQLYQLAAPDRFACNRVNLFKAPAGATLQAETRYLLLFSPRLSGTADIWASVTSSDAEDGVMGDGWRIDDVVKLNGSPLAGGQALMIDINARSMTADITAPTVVSATVDGTSMVLTYSEALAAASVPGSDAFSVQVNGSAAALADTGAVALEGATVTLTLATAVSADQAVTVTYTAPTGQGATPLRDAEGNPVVSDTAERTVANETAVVAPGAPANVTAAASDGRVTLAWTAPSEDGGTPVTSYRIRYAAGTSVPNNTAWTDVGMTFGTTVTGLANGTDYAFEVQAVNGVGAGAPAAAQATPSAAHCNAPDLSKRRQVWQGTLSVGRQAGGRLRELVGYGWTSRTGALSGRTTPIVLGANRYRIGDFVLLYAHTTGLDVLLGLPAAGTLVFHLIGDTNRNAELTETERAGLALHVCDAKFDFSAATRPGGTVPGEIVPSEPEYAGYDRHYLWENAGVNWSAGLSRTLTLSLPVSSGVRAAAVEGLPVPTGPGEDGAYAPGDRIEVRVRFDAPVTVDASGGAPTLGLALGGVRREAAYEPGQDGAAATELVFALAVSGEDAGAGAAKAIANGIRLNGATIRDEGGADAVLGFGAAPGVVAVEIVAEPSGDGAWTAGEAVEVTLAFAEPIEVGTAGGTPSVGLTLPGAGTRRAVYASGSGTGRLSFAYTLTETDGSVSAALVDPDGLALGGGTIVSTGGLDAVLTHSGAGRTAGPRAPGPILSVADAASAEGGTLVFQVTLSPPASGPVTVAYATADGPSPNGALASEDYTAVSGTLTFKPGEREKTVEVEVPDDALGEGAEMLMLGLSDATGAAIGDGEATGTIGASAGPAALTASFFAAPPEHDGQAPFTVELRFSEEPHGLSYRTVRDSLFAVSGGTLTRTRRLEPPANLRYELTLTPSSDGAVTLARMALPACGAPGAVCTGDGRALTGVLALGVPGPAVLSVADAAVKEEPEATLGFAVRLDRARHAQVTVDYATRDGTATAGADYVRTSGTLTFAPGEKAKTVEVRVLADVHDEGSETMTLALSNAEGARIADAEAVGTISNSGSIPQAWIARFGRTVAEHVLDAVETRREAEAKPGMEVSLAGQRIGGAALPEKDAGRQEAERSRSLTDWLNGGTDPQRQDLGSRTLTERDLLTRSSFALTAATKGSGLVSIWGRGAVTRFDGREGDLEVDGEVATGMLGADWTQGAWKTGLLVSHSLVDGGYRGASAGTVTSTLTGIFPWVRHALGKRLSVWGVAGYGEGSLTVEPEDEAKIRTDLDLWMAAAGLRGVLVDGGNDRPTLAARTDAMIVRTSSDEVSGGSGGNLAAVEAEVTRLRLGLEGSQPVTLGEGAALTPSIEIGVRHDGGDAETGFGVDIGGGLAWSDTRSGITAAFCGRALLTHEADGFRERGLSGSLSWDPQPASDRGPRASISQTLGGSASGGMHALLARDTLTGLAANDNDGALRRLAARFDYGFATFGDRFTSVPEIAVGLSNAGRDYSLGWRLVRGSTPGGGAFEFAVEALRRESANADIAPEHQVGFRVNARF